MPGPAATEQPEHHEESTDPRLPTGTVTSVDGAQVFVELGPRSHGVISIDEFDEPPKPGDTYQFSLVSIQDNLWTRIANKMAHIFVISTFKKQRALWLPS